MENLKLIAAVGKNNELGRKNDLCWRIKEDLRFFRDTTMGHYILVGENTYKSMPSKLPGRRYLVLSPTMQSNEDRTVFGTLESFIEFAKSTDELIFVSGGAMVYGLMIPYVSEIILTEINGTADADVFFPSFDKSNWKISSRNSFTDGDLAYDRVVYIRK